MLVIGHFESNGNWRTNETKGDQIHIKSLSLFPLGAWVKVTLRSSISIPSSALVGRVF